MIASDMSGPISLFIVVFTLVNVLACLWLMWWSARHQNADANDPNKTHTWDGDLAELNNPLPRWWLGLFIITIVFGLAYLILFPGLGNFSGTRNWSQQSQHAEETRVAQSKFEQHLPGLENSSVTELAANPAAMATARNLFGLHCSTCHGSDARGAKGFPNLADADWLHNKDADSIYQTIAQGRQGVMPAWGSALGKNGVEHVSAYVLSLSGRKVPPDFAEAGRTLFATMCAACHGANGKGNPLLGAPNLTDQAWLYGGSLENVRDVIANGRSNQMPAHEEILGANKTKLMAAYVLSLSSSAPATADQH